jgi:hypothetical protein
MLKFDDEHRDSRFILVWALDRDQVITLRPVGVSLCVGLIVFYHLLCIGVPMASFYIDSEGRGAITILVGSREGVLN